MNNENEITEEEKRGARERLLDAAQKLFCERGYEGTSVRDITTEANCNLAAVNYHFGGKDPLYMEMFRRQMKRNIDRQLETLDRISRDPDATLEDLIRGLVEPPLRGIAMNDPQITTTRLMVVEVISRRLATAEIIVDIKSLLFNQLAEAIRRFYPELTLRQAQLVIFSVDSLFVHPMLFMEHYGMLIPDISVEEVIEQVVRFSVAGIRGSVKGMRGEQ